MRGIHAGILYDTETATLVHENDSMGGGYVQSLYQAPNGGWFYVNEFANGTAAMHSFDDPCDLYKSWAKDRGFEDYRGDGAALVWLERHGGVDAILERWPERIMAG